MAKNNVATIGILILSALLYFKVIKPLYDVPPVPQLKETWWGSGDPAQEDTSIRPFKINVSDEILADLQQRLANALPFQEPLEGAKQHYGMNAKLLKTVVDFWRTKYNWREREKFLNQFPQYTVNIQGLRIHYIHVKPTNTKGLKVLPLLLVHGWPGSVREFYEIIPLLTTPQQGMDFVFEVVAPSLPGYGFSEASVRPGLTTPQMAVIFKNLMERLGHKRGDWGAAVVNHMATLFPEKIIGMHSNMCQVNSFFSNLKLYIASFYPTLFMSPKVADRVYPMTDQFKFLILETGYFHLQATKPDTLGVALRESPVGLAAYILEKFTTWTNPAWKDLDDGGLTKKYPLENLLDNVMIYWVTRSITTSIRLYADQFHKDVRDLNLDSIPIDVPTGCSLFEHEIMYLPEWVLKDRFRNLVHVSHHEEGHFPAFEVPHVLAGEIYVFVQKVEDLKKT
ncbi:hypothetical protein NQ318_017916 [Aromia moschata]|uniref:Epoxide hydrolase n=1 Tax=Aromia moschata TaxID=1265417 RepID=A0AAV8YAW1_9CUCU|nr:hypothetical protein NQ318_017916 [Aromia moschata]